MSDRLWLSLLFKIDAWFFVNIPIITEIHLYNSPCPSECSVVLFRIFFKSYQLYFTLLILLLYNIESDSSLFSSLKYINLNRYSNCLFRFAEGHNLVALRDFAISFIYNNFCAVAREEEFLELSKEYYYCFFYVTKRKKQSNCS